MSQPKTIGEIILQIEQAFSQIIQPGINDIIHSGSKSDPEVKHALEHLNNKTWRDLTLENILGTRDTLPLLTSKGLNYYLPAYLIAILRYPVEVDVLLDNIVQILAPDPHSSHYMMTMQLREICSFEQKRAIMAFLEFLQSQMPELEEQINAGIRFWSIPPN